MIRIRNMVGGTLTGADNYTGFPGLSREITRISRNIAGGAMSWGDDDTIFDVVINDEEQYSIWPTYKPIPPGWRAVGKQAKKAECLAYVDEVWTDMRPLSLRKALAEQAAGSNSSSNS